MMPTVKSQEQETIDLEKQLDAIAEQIAAGSLTVTDVVLTDNGEVNDAEPVSKPAIDFLEDAVDSDGNPKFKVGDKIVIERHTSLLAVKSWLDTRTYVVKKMDVETGELELEDPDLRQHVHSNFKRGIKEFGYVFKLANAQAGISKKRGRPRKLAPKPEKPVTLDANGKPIKKKRGRPKGAKNRPKDVITAEKQIKQAERMAKFDAKQAKLKGKKK